MGKNILTMSVLAIIIISHVLYADTTGKITGVVTDSETNEPLPGAVVELLGTTIGANTDNDGKYILKDVPVGTYSLQAKMMGYEPVTCTNIKSIMGLTTTINFKLKPTVMEVKGITVEAKRQQVIPDATTTSRVVSTKEINALPNTDAGKVVGNTAQDASSSGTLNKREGHSDEIAYFKDDTKPDKKTEEEMPPSIPSEVAAKPEALKEGIIASPAKKPISPGVKAGWEDDNKQFNYFLNFLEKYKYVESYKIDISGRVIFTVKDIDGKPIANCLLTIKDNKGNYQTKRKTYANGQAMFFTSENSISYNQNRKQSAGPVPIFSVMPVIYESFTVEAEYNQQTAKSEFTPDGRRSIDINLNIKRPKIKKVPLDIAFLLDATGSMGDEIARLKATLQMINYQIGQISPSPDVRFGMVAYRDRGDEFVTLTRPFVSKTEVFQKSLDSLQAGGGGDTPEDIQEGLKEAISGLKWRDSAIKLVFLVADAPPHIYRDQKYTYITAMHQAAAQGIKIFSIGASGLDIQGEYIFRQLAQYTMGQFIFLTYGEKGESEGGTSTSVSHHTGSNFQTENLDAIIVRIIKQELANQSDQPIKIEPEYFETTAPKDADKDKVLTELFSEGVRQLLDYSIIKIDTMTPTAVMPITIYDESLRKKSEALEDRLILNLAKIRAFRLLERKDLRQIMSEHKLSLTGAFDSDKSITVGKLVGAQILILPKLHIDGGKLELYLKMVKVETGEIMSITLLKLDDWLI
jgi:hypothetical protein